MADSPGCFWLVLLEVSWLMLLDINWLISWKLMADVPGNFWLWLVFLEVKWVMPPEVFGWCSRMFLG